MNTTGYTPSPDALAALEAGDIDALLAASRARFAGWRMDGSDAGDGDAGDDGADGGDDTGSDGDDTDKDGKDGDKPDDKDPRVTRANKDAAKYRTQLRGVEKELADTKTLLERVQKAFGGKDDDDPTEVATKAAEKAATLEAEKAALQAELLVTRLAPKHNADAEALLDSRSFTDTLAGLDQADDDYSDQVAQAIKDAVSKNAAYRAGQGSSRGGSELNGEQRETRAGKRPTSLGGAISAALSGK
jgi:hypothetical protein